jgi:hypothetical protein
VCFGSISTDSDLYRPGPGVSGVLNNSLLLVFENVVTVALWKFIFINIFFQKIIFKA